jgi:hypothetical protein
MQIFKVRGVLVLGVVGWRKGITEGYKPYMAGGSRVRV